MMAPGHLAVGLALYHGLTQMYGYTPPPAAYGVVAFASLLPDIDHPKSQVGRMFPTLSGVIAGVFGHRGFTHSAVALVLCVVAAYMWGGVTGGLLVAFGVGYVSHVLADFCTKTGVPLFWPWRENIRLPVLNFTTGGAVEHLITLALTAWLASDVGGLI